MHAVNNAANVLSKEKRIELAVQARDLMYAQVAATLLAQNIHWPPDDIASKTADIVISLMNARGGF